MVLPSLGGLWDPANGRQSKALAQRVHLDPLQQGCVSHRRWWEVQSQCDGSVTVGLRARRQHANVMQSRHHVHLVGQTVHIVPVQTIRTHDHKLEHTTRMKLALSTYLSF